MVCLSGPSMFILSSYTLVWSPKAGYPYVVLGVLSVHPLSTIWPFFLFWHPTWSICIFTAIPQTLVSVWIPFGVCPEVVGSDTWHRRAEPRGADSPGLERSVRGVMNAVNCTRVLVGKSNIDWSYVEPMVVTGIVPGLWWFPILPFSLQINGWSLFSLEC